MFHLSCKKSTQTYYLSVKCGTILCLERELEVYSFIRKIPKFHKYRQMNVSEPYQIISHGTFSILQISFLKFIENSMPYLLQFIVKSS